MCFAPKLPEPKKAPSPPDKNLAAFDAVQEQRKAAAGSFGRSDTMLTKVSDEAVSGTAAKKRLLGQ